MKNALPLPDEKKLLVTYRVEPGCLGPKGTELIVDFCVFAQKGIKHLDSDYIVWDITPRHEKSLPEIQFSVMGKRMSHAQAEKYLEVFGKSLDEFEGHLVEKLALFIDEFSGHS